MKRLSLFILFPQVTILCFEAIYQRRNGQDASYDRQ